MSEHPREQEQEQDKPQAAVALKYDPAREGAPRVTAKGKGLIAEQILALAREHQVHIHESPELLEVLIRLELGEEIPEALYRRHRRGDRFCLQSQGRVRRRGAAGRSVSVR